MPGTDANDTAAEKRASPDGITEFYRQEKLLKAGALQDAIFNSANFSSIATDEKGVIQIFNVGAERMLGYAAADVVNRITPADISDPQELIARASTLSLELETPITPGFDALVFKASRGIEDIYELTHIRKDGSRFPAIVSVTALRDAQEKIIGYLLIGTDNTARKRAEEALLKAGALQNAIFSSANFSSIATDEKGVIQIFNVGAERMLGYVALDVVNRITPADISDPLELIARADVLSQELETSITPGFEALVFKASRGIEDIYELTYIRKDGSRFPAIVSVTALRDAQEGIIGYLLIGTDNTARKQVEEARTLLDQRLRDQQFYTRSLIESNIDALMMTNPQGIISDVNEQMIALTGRTRDELIGAPCKNFFTDPAQADAAIKRVLTENKVRNYELTVRALNGEETVVSYNAATFHDRDRKLQGVFAAARDVTERKRFELTLQEKNIELENASRMKSAFLAAMSHELRTPMNGVIGMVDVLQQTKLNDYQLEMVDLIRESAFSLLSIIDDVLDFSKIEAGRLEIEQAPFSIADVVEKACGMLDQLAIKNDVTFTLFVDPTIPDLVLGDALRLRQVLLNLVSNAVKFSSGRDLPGTVEMCVLLTESSAEKVRIEFHVIDNGIGIDEVTRGLLFTAFSQADASTTRRFGGTGLGLVISRHLVDLMGGWFNLKSAAGNGSTFSVQLEFAQLPDGSQIAPRVSEIQDLACFTVGPDGGLTDTIAAYLMHGGAHVARASDMHALRFLMEASQAPLLICIVDAADISVSQEELLAFARSMSGQNISFVYVERGSRRHPYARQENMILIDGNVLTRRLLWQAVALAAGRASAEPARLPRGSHQAAFDPPSRAQALRDGRLILVAEDNESNQKVIVRQLALLGFAADLADNGRTALAQVQRCNYALLLTDLHMPELDGYELTAAIRAWEDGKQRLPVLALTANVLSGESDRCRAAGMDDYLCKPLQLKDLKIALQKWLPVTTAIPLPQEGNNFSSVSTQVIDISVLENMVGNDPLVLNDFLHHFQMSAARIADTLRLACVAQDAQQAGGHAHKLKSSALAVGALALGARCAEMEAAGKEGNSETLLALLPAFEQELAAVNAFLDIEHVPQADRRRPYRKN